MQEREEQTVGLPENAGRELKEGEKYHPVMSPDKVYPEVNVRSVGWGIVMAVLFSAAAAYLGLKIGQVFEAAIPIAIIAVGLSSATKRKNALGENVIIQSIGACSGVIVAGAIFTLPAIYILQSKGIEISVDFYQVFLSSLLGGVLGILFLIPFRKYFVSDMHGKYPFPEATATTQVLISGEKGGDQARPLIIAGLAGGLYDFLVATFGAWAETFTSKVLPFGETLYTKAKLMFSVNVGAAILGLGYIIGLRYAAIICAGSALIWFVVVPVMPLLGDTALHVINPIFEGSVDGMTTEQIFSTFARHIGIGGIAMAGIIGIIRSWSIIRSAVGLAASEMKGKSKASSVAVERTQRDLPMKIVAIGVGIALLVTFVFFFVGVVDFNIWHAVVGILIVAVIAFLFTTVAANAIAIVGTNPVSGMTLMTLILSSVIMVAVGLKGASGMVAAAIIGGVVCTALSMAGGFITDLKVGYWLGSTPAQATDLEVSRYARIGCNCRRSYDNTQQNIRFRRRRSGRSSGECYGGCHRASDGWHRCSMAVVWHRCGDSHCLDAVSCACFGFCSGYVYTAIAQYSSTHRGIGGLVRIDAFQRQSCQYCSQREGHTRGFGLHCGWCFDGCRQCRHQVRRARPHHTALEYLRSRTVALACCIRCSDRFLHLVCASQ